MLRRLSRVEDEAAGASLSPAGPISTSRFLRFSEAVLDHHVIWVPFAIALGYFLVVNVRRYGFRLGDWDLLLLSGFATLVIGLRIARTVPSRMHATLQRLVNRRVLDLGPSELKRLLQELDARSLRWAAITGPITALMVTAAFLGAIGDRNSLAVRLPVMLLRAAGAYVAGLHLGRMASYGTLGLFLKRRGCHINVWPGHVDGAAGLKPLGDFYFYQAMLAGIPALFLAVWWFLIPLIGRYARWRDPYLAELAVAIVVEVLAFLVPLLWFHREMANSKLRLLEEADHLSTEILAPHSHRSVPEAEDGGGRTANLEWARQRYDAIEQMPTWPVDVKTRRRFSLNNLALLLPLIGQAFGRTELAGRIAEIIGGVS